MEEKNTGINSYLNNDQSEQERNISILFEAIKNGDKALFDEFIENALSKHLSSFELQFNNPINNRIEELSLLAITILWAKPEIKPYFIMRLLKKGWILIKIFFVEILKTLKGHL